ncbi:MAG: HAMP domain-containing histidine kinase [Chloroflexi bacterium]|nr:HAMP domain-containing histidine kinase [Chloroflexota bacterium]
MSLRSRLILTHALVILITLIIIAGSMIYILRGYSLRVQLARLEAAVVPLSFQARAMLQNNVPPKEILTRLESQVGSVGHILIINQKGLVLADAANGLTNRTVQLSSLDRPVPYVWGRRVVRGQVGTRTLVYAGIASGEYDGQTIYLALAANESPIGTALEEITPSLLIATVLTLLVSLLIALLLARSIARPISQLTQATEAFARGQYDHRVPETGRDEIGRLAASFNSMAERVQRSRQMEKDFVANVSHELKTPLTSIQGFSQAILDGAVLDLPGARKAAQTIFDETARMSRLVGDLLTLARFESGEMPLAKEAFDLGSVLPSWVDRFQPTAHSQGITLTTVVDPLPPLTGDAGRLEQVVSNLVDNAIKYNHAGGSVTVSAKAETIAIQSKSRNSMRGRRRVIEPPGPQWASITVADTGAGIRAEDLPRLFNRFYRGDRARAAGGTGLGLSIAQEIIQAHGGEITVDSVLGQGTTFVIHLPVRDGAANNRSAGNKNPHLPRASGGMV